MGLFQKFKVQDGKMVSAVPEPEKQAQTEESKTEAPTKQEPVPPTEDLQQTQAHEDFFEGNVSLNVLYDSGTQEEIPVHKEDMKRVAETLENAILVRGKHISISGYFINPCKITRYYFGEM